MDIEQLISEVKKCEPIYNSKLKAHREKHLLDNAWKTIGEKLKCDGQECKKQWNILRNSFARHLREDMMLSRSSSKKRRKWFWTDAMEFMREHMHITHKQEECSYTQKYEICLEGIDETSIIEKSEFNCGTPPNLMHSPANTTKSTSIKACTAEILGVMPECSQSYNKEDDADMLFLKSLHQDLQLLKGDRKWRFKIVMMQELQTNLEEQRAENEFKDSMKKELLNFGS